MRVSSRGIVARQIRYGDNKLVVDVYSRLEGMRGFMVRTGTRPGGKIRKPFFFPLSQIEFSYERKAGGNAEGSLPYMADVKLAYVYRSLYSDVRKSSMAFFMAEVLGRCITQSEPDEGFFERIWQALQDFDRRQSGFSDFHLFFLMEIISLLGVCPRVPDGGGGRFFDFREGCFVPSRPAHGEYAAGEAVSDMVRLIGLHEKENFPAGNVFTRQQRQRLLPVLADYCRMQSGMSGDFLSMSVLRSLYEEA